MVNTLETANTFEIPGSAPTYFLPGGNRQKMEQLLFELPGFLSFFAIDDAPVQLFVIFL